MSTFIPFCWPHFLEATNSLAAADSSFVQVEASCATTIKPGQIAEFVVRRQVHTRTYQKICSVIHEIKQELMYDTAEETNNTLLEVETFWLVQVVSACDSLLRLQYVLPQSYYAGSFWAQTDCTELRPVGFSYKNNIVPYLPHTAQKALPPKDTDNDCKTFQVYDLDLPSEVIKFIDKAVASNSAISIDDLKDSSQKMFKRFLPGRHVEVFHSSTSKTGWPAQILKNVGGRLKLCYVSPSCNEATTCFKSNKLSNVEHSNSNETQTVDVETYPKLDKIFNANSTNLNKTVDDTIYSEVSETFNAEKTFSIEKEFANDVTYRETDKSSTVENTVPSGKTCFDVGKVSNHGNRTPNITENLVAIDTSDKCPAPTERSAVQLCSELNLVDKSLGESYAKVEPILSTKTDPLKSYDLSDISLEGAAATVRSLEEIKDTFGTCRDEISEQQPLVENPEKVQTTCETHSIDLIENIDLFAKKVDCLNDSKQIDGKVVEENLSGNSEFTRIMNTEPLSLCNSPVMLECTSENAHRGPQYLEQSSDTLKFGDQTSEQENANCEIVESKVVWDEQKLTDLWRVVQGTSNSVNGTSEVDRKSNEVAMCNTDSFAVEGKDVDSEKNDSHLKNIKVHVLMSDDVLKAEKGRGGEVKDELNGNKIDIDTHIDSATELTISSDGNKISYYFEAIDGSNSQHKSDSEENMYDSNEAGTNTLQNTPDSKQETTPITNAGPFCKADDHCVCNQFWLFCSDKRLQNIGTITQNSDEGFRYLLSFCHHSKETKPHLTDFDPYSCDQKPLPVALPLDIDVMNMDNICAEDGQCSRATRPSNGDNVGECEMILEIIHPLRRSCVHAARISSVYEDGMVEVEFDACAEDVRLYCSQSMVKLFISGEILYCFQAPNLESLKLTSNLKWLWKVWTQDHRLLPCGFSARYNIPLHPLRYDSNHIREFVELVMIRDSECVAEEEHFINNSNCFSDVPPNIVSKEFESGSAVERPAKEIATAEDCEMIDISLEIVDDEVSEATGRKIEEANPSIMKCNPCELISKDSNGFEEITVIVKDSSSSSCSPENTLDCVFKSPSKSVSFGTKSNSLNSCSHRTHASPSPSRPDCLTDVVQTFDWCESVSKDSSKFRVSIRSPPAEELQFMVGDKLEVVLPTCPDALCVATIVAITGHLLWIRYDLLDADSMAKKLFDENDQFLHLNNKSDKVLEETNSTVTYGLGSNFNEILTKHCIYNPLCLVIKNETDSARVLEHLNICRKSSLVIYPSDSSSIFPAGWAQKHRALILVPDITTLRNGCELEVSQSSACLSSPSLPPPLLLRSTSELSTSKWCPAMYLHYQCCPGLLLSRTKLAGQTGVAVAGSVASVLSQVASQSLSAAFCPTKLIKELATALRDTARGRLSWRPVRVKSKCKRYSVRGEVMAPTERCDVPIFVAVVVELLQCCRNLWDFAYRPSCPYNCKQTSPEFVSSKKTRRLSTASGSVSLLGSCLAPDEEDMEDDYDEQMDDVQDDEQKDSSNWLRISASRECLADDENARTSFGDEHEPVLTCPDTLEPSNKKLKVSPAKALNYYLIRPADCDGDPLEWSTEQVCEYVSSHPNIGHHAAWMQRENIDGHALMLLNLPSLQDFLEESHTALLPLAHELCRLKMAHLVMRRSSLSGASSTTNRL